MNKKWIAVVMACVLMLASLRGFAASFGDVTEAQDWAKADIESYAERGIVAGDGQGSFFPDNSVTRAEFAKMLCLVFGLETAAELTYTDLDADSWQYDFVAKTDAYTYTEGEKTYAPNKPATRAEIAYAIVNAAGFEKKDAEMPFDDAGEVLPALAGHAKTAYALELLRGYPDNTFRPNAPVTRAEVVVLLARAEDAKAAQPPAEEPTDPPAPEAPSAGDAEKEPEKEEEQQPVQQSVKISPMDTLCYLESATAALDPMEDEECLRLRFYLNGSEKLYTLYADKDVPVYNTDGTPSTLQTGDLFCINTNLYGEVKEVRIILRMGNEPILEKPFASETLFSNMLYVPAADKWGYLEDGKKHEVYLGFFGRMEYEEEEAKIYIYPSDGKKSADGVRIISVPADALVTTYTTNAKAKHRYGVVTMETLEYYEATTDEYGNIAWYDEKDTDYYQYVFVKTENDVITDLIVISNR